MATTSEVAHQLGVTPATIRNYAQKFANHLSPEAAPEPGHVRQFNDDDVALLSQAKTLLRNGLTYAQADERLAVIDVASMPPPPQAPGTAMVPADSVRLIVQPYIQERDRVLAERDTALARVAELERQVGELAGRLAEQRRTWWQRLLGR